MMQLVVLSCVLAAATASGLLAAPYAQLAYAAPLWQPSNYRGPLSLAPGQPANILGADGRPLDTLDVNLDRAAHFTAKAFDGLHLLKKRSAAFVAPYAAPFVAPYAASYVAPYASPFAYSASLVQPYNYRGPLSLAPGQPASILGADGRPLDTLDVNLDRSAHITAKALSGAHILKKRSAVLAPVSTVTIARTSLIAPAYASYSAPIATHYSPITYAARPYAHYF